MGDSVIDDMRSRNRRYIIIIVFVVVSIIFGSLLFFLPSDESSQSNSNPGEEKESSKSNQEEGEKQVIVPQQNNSANSSNNSVEEEVIDRFDFDIKTYKFLDERACGAPPEKLFEWFGDPLYALGWEKLPSGKRGEPNSFKFWVWNQSVIFTKGKMNVSSNTIETYHYIVREGTNNSIQVLVDCYELSNNSS